MKLGTGVGGALTVVIGLVLVSAPVLASDHDYSFLVDSTQSSVTVEVEALGLTDSDTSPIEGFIEATLTPPAGTYTEIHITAAVLDLTEQVDLLLDAAFLGGVEITGTDMGVRLGYGFGAAGPPAPVDPAGEFNQVGNLLQPVGTMSYAGYGVVGSQIGSGTEDLSTYDPSLADLMGNVSDDGANVMLDGSVFISDSFDFNGVATTVTISGTLVATAPLAPIGCPGDSNCDGAVNWRDIDYFVAAQNDNLSAWAALFAPDVPSCPFENNDVNDDGGVNWRDIDAFVAVQNTTCP